MGMFGGSFLFTCHLAEFRKRSPRTSPVAGAVGGPAMGTSRRGDADGMVYHGDQVRR